jgi:transcriptional regulator GlxA family with amidase domain
MNRIPLRAFFYLISFLIPPLMLGLALTFSSLSELMIRKAPPQGLEVIPAVSPVKDASQRAAILLSNSGTEITDLLGPASILHHAGFETFTVAPERRPSITTGAVNVLPDYAFENAPAASVLVIPAVLDPDNEKLISWVKVRAASSNEVLVLGEGARLAAAAGILKGLKATSHFLALDDLRQTYPDTDWQKGARAVHSGKIITSAGVTASIDATLLLVEALRGEKARAEIQKNLSIPSGMTEIPGGLKPSDYLSLFIEGGFDWNKAQVAVALFSGMEDLALAASLDALPRALNARVFTIDAAKMDFSPVKTSSGITLYPNYSMDNASRPDWILIPSAGENPEHFSETTVIRWAQDQNIRIVDERTLPAGLAVDRSLDLISKGGLQTGSPTHPELSQMVAKLVEYPAKTPEQPTPVSNHFLLFMAGLYRPLLLGILGILVARIFDRRLFGVRAAQPSMQ